MSYTDQQKKEVLDHYFEVSNNVGKTIEQFGYPEKSTLWLWIKKDPRYISQQISGKLKYPLEMRLEAVKMMLEEGMSGSEVTAKLGIANHASVYMWRRAYLNGGVDALIPKKSGRPSRLGHGDASATDIEELQARVRLLEQENYNLRAALDVLGKDK